ncbi:MAG TPA: universal stress protein UspA [Ruminiclostridium sp.]|nr:universal stress protein [Clostridiaceae bacterium]HAA25657.1 universal stress protein UspA [Ruminiclostridium sp.]
MDLYKNILVCVTKQKNCERLIKAASEYRLDQGILHVLHVAKNSWNILDNSRESEALEYLFRISKSYGAEMTVLRNDNISETIAGFALQQEIDLIVLGESSNEHENKYLKQLRNILKDKPIKIIEV